MKRFILGILFGGLSSVLMAEQVISYEQWLEKKDRGDAMILCVGSDWLPESGELTQSFMQVAKNASTKKIAWVLYDRKDLIDRKTSKRKNPPVAIYGYPAWIYTDHSKRIIRYRESISDQDVQELASVAESLEKQREERDVLLEKANQEGLSKIEQARRIGAALEPIVQPVMLREPFVVVNRYLNSYKDLQNKIKELDPEDQTGYGFKYSFYYLPIMEKVILANCDAKKFEDNYRYVDNKLKLKVLTTRQRQQLLIFKYTTAMRENKIPKALRFLDQVIAVDPSSEFAQMSKRIQKYYTEPVLLKDMSWNNKDNRPVWTEMIVDVSNIVKAGGKYRLQFVHEKGGTSFRNPRLFVGNREIAKGEEKGKRRKGYLFSLKQSPVGKVTLHAELMGRGWFSGRGKIVLEPVGKK